MWIQAKLVTYLSIENLAQNYDTQNTLQVTQPEESKLPLDNASPEDIPQLEQN